MTFKKIAGWVLMWILQVLAVSVYLGFFTSQRHVELKGFFIVTGLWVFVLLLAFSIKLIRGK